jgi:hypothetical protein
MIIHPDAYLNLYSHIPTDDLLIDTWFSEHGPGF